MSPFAPPAIFQLGVLAAWRSTLQMVRRRSITVLTAAEAGMPAVLCTRVRLNGDVQTRVSVSWLRAGAGEPADAVVARHFQAVSAALAGWPAVVGFTRVLAWIAGLALGALSLRELVAVGLGDLTQLVLGWRFWLYAVPLALGACVRYILRAWLRREMRLGLR